MPCARQRKIEAQTVFIFNFGNSTCGPEVGDLLEQLSLCISIMRFIPLST